MTKPVKKQLESEEQPVGAWIVVGAVVLAFVIYFTITLVIFLTRM